MTEIIFIYNDKEIPIQCSDGEKIRNLIEKFYYKINITKNFEFRLNNGKILNEELTENEIPINEDNKKIILVNEKNDTSNIDKKSKIPKGVICPICREICLIKIKDYKIQLYDCKNHHNSNILINQFKETQINKQTDIICNICNEKNKGNIQNKFYKCLICKINICLFFINQNLIMSII